jgi:hypothetical protein
MRDYKAAGSRYHTRTESDSPKVPIWLRWSGMALAAVFAATLLGWQLIGSRDDGAADSQTPATDANAIPLELPPAEAAAISSAASPADIGATNPR